MRSPRFVLAALALLAPLALHAPLQAQAGGAATAHARVVVKFKADSPVFSREKAQALSAGATGAARATAMGERIGITLRYGGAVGERVQTVLADGISSAELAQRLSAQSDVEYAEPAVRHKRFAPPNDPLYPAGQATNTPAAGQWYLRAPTGGVVSSIDVEPAWDITQGSNSVVVAVLDTGVRFDHADLGANLLPGYDMIAADPDGSFDTANDNNGRDSDASDPGDWISASEAGTGNFATCGREDSSWHGTQTSSLIGALTNNGVGMASVGRNVRILPVRVLGKCGGYTDDIAAGIRWAAGIHIDGVPDNTNPAKVINLSLGGENNCGSTYRDAIAEANARGAVVVVSAGNSAGHAVSQPGNCPGAIAVTGLRHVGTKVGFADVGTQVAIAAPGGNCVNTGANDPCLYPIITATNSGATTPVAAPGGTTYTNAIDAAVGTSFSAPLVSGTAGLLFSVRPNLSVGEVRAILQGSSRAFPTSGGTANTPVCRAPNGTDQLECYCTTSTCGAGMLDAGAAVTAANRGLLARIAITSATPRATEVVTLSAGGSYVLTGRTISSYAWSLVDGGGIVSAVTGNGATATATPSAAGSFTVNVTVTDSTGATSVATQVVTVAAASTPPPPLRTDGGGGGGALGLFWLAGLAMAVAALALQRRNALCRMKAVRVAERRRR